MNYRLKKKSPPFWGFSDREMVTLCLVFRDVLIIQEQQGPSASLSWTLVASEDKKMAGCSLKSTRV